MLDDPAASPADASASAGDGASEGGVRRVTMHDVARAAGVSQTLVSIVFRDAPGASEETRAHVRRVADDLGYRRDERARRLRQGRTRLLGVVFEPLQPFHGELVDGVQAAAGAGGYDVVLAAMTPHRTERAAIESLLRDRCEGLLLLGTALPTEELERLARTVPVVSVTRGLAAGDDVDGRGGAAARQPRLSSVALDDRAGMRLAVEHLRARGHERIACLVASREAGGEERRAGYLEGMREAGLAPEVLALGGEASERLGATAVREIAGRAAEARPTALIAFNDRCAVGALGQARALGLEVPDDLAVVGFDDSEQASLPYNDLSSLAQDPALLARTGVALALADLGDDAARAAVLASSPEGVPAGRHVVLPTRLVVRSSTGGAGR